MTHPPGQPGGGGGSDGGTTGPGRLVDAYDRAMAHLDGVFDRVLTRLGTSIASRRTVGEADAMSSVADLRAAAWMREGLVPSELDRNGHPIRAGLTTT